MYDVNSGSMQDRKAPHYIAIQALQMNHVLGVGNLSAGSGLE